jgi:hypothetical protein
VTRPARAAVAASAVMADRYATAAAIAAREATRAADIARKPARVENVAAQFVARAEEAAITGKKPRQTISANTGYGQMAGIADTAKYTAAAANAARYAAESARQAGAHRAARHAERAAQLAASWADMARSRAASGHYAPYTATQTARYARRAAAAAAYAARSSGPLGRCATSAVGLAVALLPTASRERYREEWKSDLWQLPSRRKRTRYMCSALAPGALRLAVVLRQRKIRADR